MNEETLTQLEKRVYELTQWKESRIRDRLKLPIDHQTKKILTYWPTPYFDGLPIFTGRVFPVGDTYITEVLALGLEVKVNDKKRALLVTFELHTYTVNPSTDVFTDSSGSHGLITGDLVGFNSSNILPLGLNTTSFYYVINPSGATFQVAETSNGSPVDVTSGGSGTQFYAKV